ncbi:hypothetical protein D8674_031361 [Pyrus ussuriensis x Pyrus communis]|uniref:Uncharacterized protein n=1 Tax=Pyrus ussuriensis x Pyrus communis TaxID=2448454 RepID=A0A5N5F158_9ROSA|nr:hypothetical protein D8674_031361 [Pyrus ussuriensis x Pyrus communis]
MGWLLMMKAVTQGAHQARLTGCGPETKAAARGCEATSLTGAAQVVQGHQGDAIPRTLISLSFLVFPCYNAASSPTLLVVPASNFANHHYLKTLPVIISDQAEAFPLPSLCKQWYPLPQLFQVLLQQVLAVSDEISSKTTPNLCRSCFGTMVRLFLRQFDGV